MTLVCGTSVMEEKSDLQSPRLVRPLLLPPTSFTKKTNQNQIQRREREKERALQEWKRRRESDRWERERERWRMVVVTNLRSDGGGDERWRMGNMAMVVVTSEWAVVVVVTSGRRDGGGGEEVKRDGLDEKRRHREREICVCFFLVKWDLCVRLRSYKIIKR